MPAVFDVSFTLCVALAPGAMLAIVQVALLPASVAPGAVTMDVSAGARSVTVTLFNVVSPVFETVIS